MRKLNGSDVFSCIRVIKTAGIKEEFKEIIKNVPDKCPESELEKIAISALFDLAEALADKGAEAAFWAFLAGPLETTAKDAASLELGQLADAFRQIVADNNIKSFFELVSGTLGRN